MTHEQGRIAELRRDMDEKCGAWDLPGVRVWLLEHVEKLESRVAELEAENERIRGELTLERGSVGRADLQTKVLLASDQRDRAWALLRDLGVTVMP